MSDAIIDRVAARLDAARRLLVFGHLRPDGDAIGAALGLAWLLRARGKQVDVSFADPIPASLRFLPGATAIADIPYDGHDLVVALDGSDAPRYGTTFLAALEAAPETLLIDHHKTGERFAPLAWVAPDYAATAQMIYTIAIRAGWTIDAAAATALATGCVTDTNAFTTDHTNPEVLESVADLMRLGAPLSTIIRQTMQLRSRSDAALWGRVLATMTVDDDIAWALSRIADRRAVGATEGDGSGIATFLRNIEGVRIGMVFIELEPERVRVSLRSEPGYDVAELAAALGGGGHEQASGLTLQLSLDEAVRTVTERARSVVRAATPIEA